MCEYCHKKDDGEIMGKTIRQFEWKETAGYKPPEKRNDFLEMFILKLKNDKKAGLMIDNGYGYRYVDINYCMFCRKEAGRVNKEEEKINNTIALEVMIIEELKRVKEKVEKTPEKNVRFKVETKHWYGFSEPFLAKDKDILDISKYTMKLILEEAINKEKERIDKLTDRIIELRRSRNGK